MLNTLQLLTAKSAVYLINMSENDYLKKSSRWLAKVKKWVDDHGAEKKKKKKNAETFIK